MYVVVILLIYTRYIKSNLRQEVEIAIKSQETCSQLEPTRNKTM